MSVMQSFMETIAQYLPDKDRDPLISRTSYVGKGLERVDGHRAEERSRSADPAPDPLGDPTRRSGARTRYPSALAGESARDASFAGSSTPA